MLRPLLFRQQVLPYIIEYLVQPAVELAPYQCIRYRKTLWQIVASFDVDDSPGMPILLLAPSEALNRVLPGFLAGCAIFCILSCANTALYVASRTHSDLTREIPSNHESWPMKALSRLGTATPRTHVPAWALLISAVSFFWLPFLHLKYGYRIQNVSRILSGRSVVKQA